MNSPGSGSAPETIARTAAGADAQRTEGREPAPDQPYVPGPVGRGLARIYTRAVEWRNSRFDAGRGVVTFDRPVISVGNLTLGGTGKTPMVHRLVALLREHGHDPCIAMRGYGSGRNADGRSDEARLSGAAFEDLPIVAQPDRVEGLLKLFSSARGERVDCVVLDDGFQHRRIARQVDLVLVDASHDLFAARVFPAGRLREPAANLQRATHVAVTHAEMVGAAALGRVLDAVRAAAPGARVAVASHGWTGLTVHEAGGDREEGASWLRGRRVVAACAIGRPASFLAAIERAGAVTMESLVLRDHDPFGPRLVERLCAAARSAGADAIVLTDKDWTKLGDRPGVEWPCPVVRPRLELRFQSGWDELASDVLAAAGSTPE